VDSFHGIDGLAASFWNKSEEGGVRFLRVLSKGTSFLVKNGRILKKASGKRKFSDRERGA
jgi:hypothetical protein